MTTIQSHDGLTIAYDMQGTGPALLLINGLTADRGIWGYTRDTLNELFTTIALDNRDSGASAAASQSYTSKDHALDALAVLDAAGFDKAFVLGHSMGGVAAQELVLLAPNRVQALILANSYAKNDTYTSELFKLASALRANLADDHTFLSAMYFYSLGRGTLNAMALSGLIDSVLSSGPIQAPASFQRQIEVCLGADTLDRLDTIAVPTLVLSSSDDKFFGDAHNEQLAGAISGAKQIRLEGIGHCPMIENPPAFLEAVTSFLKNAA